MVPGGKFDSVVAALGHKYRRRLLVSLMEHNPQSDTDTRDAAAALEGVTHGDGDDDFVRTELVHTHLPKLRDLGFITWDRGTGTVERGPEFEEIEPLLELLLEHDEELPEDWL